MRHKDMVNIAQAKVESTQVILFHFVCDGKHPRYSHPVSGCELLCQDKTVSELRPGAPTDDDPSQLTCLLAKRAPWTGARRARTVELFTGPTATRTAPTATRPFRWRCRSTWPPAR